MEIKTREKLERVRVESTVYIAFDGKEFESKSECEKYEEKNRERMETMKKIEKMKIYERDDLMPINYHGEPCNCSEFTWYKLENEEQFELLNKHYERRLRNPRWYPTLYCVESEYHGMDCNDSVYGYSQADLEEETRGFWSELGYDVVLIKREEKEQ